ncbi:MAG TPA: hypothetical protein VFS21_25410 [Roseiflexaceae bacterium]|nr:hypothetical protein [Roseiflexaceae bacterium]
MLFLFINDQINERLKTALASETSAPVEAPPATETKSAAPETNGDAQDTVATTSEEIEGHLIIKAILRDKLDVKRIIMRDAKQYCAILLDDNNRKPICRLWFNRTQKYIGFLDAQKQEERIPIEGLDDIYKLADRLRGAVELYDKKPVMV